MRVEKRKIDCGLCPVCDAAIRQCRRLNGLFVSFCDTQVDCDACGEYRLRYDPIGPRTWKYREWFGGKLVAHAERQVRIDECRRLWCDPRRWKVEAEDHVGWMVYADWLEEEGYPLTAASVRLKHGSICGTASDKAE